MAPRLDLQAKLETLLGSDAVYFQPPATISMKYPCIVYKRARIELTSADNIPYRAEKLYQVTVIDRDPDSPIPDQIAALPRCRHDTQFVADGLNHDVFSLYF